MDGLPQTASLIERRPYNGSERHSGSGSVGHARLQPVPEVPVENQVQSVSRVKGRRGQVPGVGSVRSERMKL